MTVIVWDGKTLAADKLVSVGGMRQTTTKILKVGDRLFGFCGNADSGREWLAWFEAGANPKDFTAAQRDKDDYTAVLVISPGPVIHKYERTPYPIVFEDKFTAMGCGREYAMMALRLGKTAREAVLLTSELSHECGNGVDELAL